MNKLALALLALSARSAVALGAPACQVTSTVKPGAVTILPGQPVDLTLSIKNVTSGALSFAPPSENVGTIALRIGTGSGPTWRWYLGPGWGSEDAVSSARVVAAGSAVERTVRVLYQSPQNQSPYVFATPGTFSVQLSFKSAAVCPAASRTPIVPVQVVAPTGIDLAVWSAIKDCARCARILHTGSAGTQPAEQDALALLRRLLQQYPTSRYAKTIANQVTECDRRTANRGKAKTREPEPEDAMVPGR